MPEIAANTTEAALSSWPLAEGATFSRDDVVATVETAKAVVDVAAEADGVLLRRLVAAGAEVEAGDAIALVAAPGEQVADVDAALRELGVGAPPEPEPKPEQAETPEPSPTSLPVNGNSRVFASPLARRMARDAGLSVEQITGTGPNGRIVRRDVERATADATATAAPAPTGDTTQAAAFTDVPHSR